MAYRVVPRRNDTSGGATTNSFSSIKGAGNASQARSTGPNRKPALAWPFDYNAPPPVWDGPDLTATAPRRQEQRALLPAEPRALGQLQHRPSTLPKAPPSRPAYKSRPSTTTTATTTTTNTTTTTTTTTATTARNNFRNKNNNGNNNHRTMPRPTKPAAVRANLSTSKGVPSWKDWDELQLKVRGLPSTVTTLELWRLFSVEGAIDYIELFEDKHGRKDGGARVRFRPPPRTAFWLGRGMFFPAPNGRGSHALDIMLDDKRERTYVPSPTDSSVKYPRIMSLKLGAIDFGFMHDDSAMMIMRSTESVAGSKIAFELELGRKNIDVRFDLRITDPRGDDARVAKEAIVLRSDADAVGALNRDERYRFRIPLEQLNRIQEVEVAPKTRFLLISLETPPIFFRKAAGALLEASHEKKVPIWSEWHTWYRQTDIVYDPRELRGAPLSLKKAKPVIDIGRWTTYRLKFDLSSDASVAAYRQVCRALQDYNVTVERVDGWKFLSNQEPAVWDCIDPPSVQLDTTTSFLAEFQEARFTPLSFAVRYQLEVCISQGRLNEHNLTKAFVQRLSELDERRALKILVHVAEQKTRVYDPTSLFALTSFRGASSSMAKIPRYCVHMRKATVTPSMIYFNTPAVETSNRVIRQYLEHSDRFLRVQFMDERFQGRIGSTYKNTADEVFTRVKRALANGITIGDRHYEFLAFGNSQFRQHGAYFFAPTPHLRADHIREWMGDFTQIRTVAKYAARIGQCFSTTRAIGGTKVQVKEILDVKRDDFNFTDGVGKISESLAKLVAAELRLPYIPSVFQFRLGGCKGVLAVWPDARNWEIHIRPSQYKFAAIHNGLEIIRWSQYAAATLNRQLIILLSALGVEGQVFMKKLEHMLANLQRAMDDEHMALEMLQRQVDPNQATLAIAAMVAEGFMKTKEPFVASLLQLWRAWSIKYLKERAKIVIDGGAFVLGCTDETRSLEGHVFGSAGLDGSLDQRVSALPEIFLQVPDHADDGKYRVVEGLCLLARNPSLHPGDIRVVSAVDRPQLRHIRDAVVLPQIGDRDVASMCSGGDLDGDDFLVIWDKDLMPPEWNHRPMDYSAPKPVELSRDVSKDDVTGFFVQYIKNDRLPSIALAHLAQADQRELGVKDDKCLRLAALHSKAVDYVKTGEPAEMPKELRPYVWPHFMERQHTPREKIYRSRSILGQLYDRVERVDFVPRQDARFDARILEAYQPDQQLLQDAKQMKSAYDTDMRRIMAQHEIATEFEVWSTFALSHSNMSKDYKFHEELGQIAQALKDRYRNTCFEKVGGRDTKALGPFVAAMYRATHEETIAALEESKAERGETTAAPDGGSASHTKTGQDGGTAGQRSRPLISFPWCFADVLGKIAMEQSKKSEAEHTLEQLEGVMWNLNKHTRPQPTEARVKVDAPSDTIETDEGLTRRGEVLELFHRGEGEDKGKRQPQTANGKSDAAPARSTIVASTDEGQGYVHTSSPDMQTAGSSESDDDSPPKTPSSQDACVSARSSFSPKPRAAPPEGESDVSSEYRSVTEGLEQDGSTEIHLTNVPEDGTNMVLKDRVPASAHRFDDDDDDDDEKDDDEDDGKDEARERVEVVIDHTKETPFEALEKLLA